MTMWHYKSKKKYLLRQHPVEDRHVVICSDSNHRLREDLFCILGSNINHKEEQNKAWQNWGHRSDTAYYTRIINEKITEPTFLSII